MALTLSVGFVVDDAIVMLENIVRHVEEGEEPYAAAVKGASEIGFTILSMTVSLAAVFIPIVFMGGIVGRLLHEFAVTIVLTILISGFVSVTLTPMLCSRFLKAGNAQEHGRFYHWSEKSFDRVQSGYERSLHWSMTHRRFDHAAVRRQSGGDDRHVLHLQGRFHPVGGYRPDPGGDGSGRPRLFRRDGPDAEPARDHRPARPQCRVGGVVGGFGWRSAHRHQYRQHAAEAQAVGQPVTLGRRDHPGTAAQAAKRAGHQRLYAESALDPGGRHAFQIRLPVCPAGHQPGGTGFQRAGPDEGPVRTRRGLPMSPPTWT